MPENRFFIRIKARIVVWKYFLNGSISFLNAFWLMLPSSLRFNKKISFRLFGKPFILPEGDSMVDFFGLTGEIILYDQYRIASVHGNVVDAGANIGIFSIFAAVKHPDATIYSFEPVLKTFNALKENTKYYPNIKVFNSALGDRSGEVKMVTDPSHSGNSQIKEDGVMSVEIKNIDSMNMRVDFLKMDVEGYEANVLKGGVKTIAQWKPIIVMSAYHKSDDATVLPAVLNSIAPYDCELRYDCDADLVCTPKS